MTRDDVDFVKSIGLQGPDMTERQERRFRRIIDDMRAIVAERTDATDKDAQIYWVYELFERSKDDRAFIAGSEVRRLCGEILNRRYTNVEREELYAQISEQIRVNKELREQLTTARELLEHGKDLRGVRLYHDAWESKVADFLFPKPQEKTNDPK